MNQESNLNALNAWLMWFKIFQYFSISKQMSLLMRILKRAAIDIAFFMFMFFIIFLGFAQAGYLAFGTDVPSFRTFSHSLLNLFRSITSDLDYSALSEANRLFGPLYYICYYVIVLLVLINVFLAIINDAYAVVNEKEKDLEPSQSSVTKGIEKLVRIFKKQGKSDSRLPLLEDQSTEKQGLLPLSEFVELFQVQGLEEEKIKIILADMGKTDNTQFDENDVLEFKKRLLDQKHEDQDTSYITDINSSWITRDGLLAAQVDGMIKRLKQLSDLSNQRSEELVKFEEMLKSFK